MEGDTKLSSLHGSAARAVSAAAVGEAQLAVTKDSLPAPVAVSQSDNRANITQHQPTTLATLKISFSSIFIEPSPSVSLFC